MPGEADRLKKENEELRKENATLQEWLDLANEKLSPGDQVMPRVVAPEEPIWAPAMRAYQEGRLADEIRRRRSSDEFYAEYQHRWEVHPLSVPERQEKLELRVHKLEGRLERPLVRWVPQGSVEVPPMTQERLERLMRNM